jgi:hypothetical protein
MAVRIASQRYVLVMIERHPLPVIAGAANVRCMAPRFKVAFAGF